MVQRVTADFLRQQREIMQQRHNAQPRIRYVCPNRVCLAKQKRVASRNCYAIGCHPREIRK